MAIDSASARSRRALLATAAGGVAVAVAGNLARPQSVAGDTGGNFILGQANSADALTSLTRTTDGVAFSASGGNGVFGIAPPGFGAAGAGVVGQSDPGVGVSGGSNTNTGVIGSSTSGNGVSGTSTTGFGVNGQSRTNNKAGLRGESFGGTGVVGFSFPGAGAPIPSFACPENTGVHGIAVVDADSRGVNGQSTSGRGVNGIATSGTGVYGTGTSGEGVRGVSTGSNGTAGTTASGIASGVYGENTGGGFGTYGRSNTGAGVGIFGESTTGTGVKGHSLSGVALEAEGRVKFSTSGLASVAVGTKSKQVTPGTDLTAASLILCTLESNQAGLAIQRVTKNVTTDVFTVFLSANVLAGKYARVAWFVIG
jgi:hypothetical protein